MRFSFFCLSRRQGFSHPAFSWIAILIAMLAVGWVSAAQPDQDFSAGILKIEDVLEASRDVTLEKYPNADDVLLDDFILSRYEEDGTGVTWDDTFVKVLTEKGKRSHQTLSFYFTLPYSRVEVRLLQVIRPDGTILPVDIGKQSREMVDPSQMGSNIYNPNSKILQVGVPDLEIGDILRYVSREEHFKPRVPNTWSDYQVFEYTSPIERYVYEVHAPKALPLQNMALKDEVPGTVVHTTREENGRVVYRWEIRNVPRMYREPDMPALHTVVQRLLISTIPDWPTISRWYWNLSEPHYETTPEMREMVRELTQGLSGREEQISSIFQWVSQKVRYMGITIEDEAPGYEPHDARLTFESRHGVCRDKAALLVALLREAGFRAYPVLIHVGPLKDEEVPQPYFNHAITAVENDDGSYMLMDSTDESTKQLFPAYLCNKSYLVAKPEGDHLRVSPIVPAEENMMRVETTGSVDAAGNLTGESVLHFNGINDNAYRGHFAGLKPEERRRFFEGVVKSFVAGGSLKSFEISPENMQDTSIPLSVRLGFEAKEILIDSGGTAMLPVPRMGASVGIANFILGKTGLEKRKYPLQTNIACGVEESLRLELDPAIGAIVTMPEYPVIEQDTLFWKRELALENGTLSGHSAFLMKAVQFNPEEYLNLKEALKDIEYNARKRPIFQRKEAAPPVAEQAATPDIEADARLLDAETEYVLTDARNWTVTTTVRKEVLTYKGKKDNSELHFDYNPVWEEVELVRASVTAGGETKMIDEKEINLMDAGWVGSAPRYPGAKTLVASLPGVEIGSVIEYQVRQTAYDHPFFSLVNAFRSTDPIVRRTIRVTAPKSLDLKMLKDDLGFFGKDNAANPIEEQSTYRDGRITWEWTIRDQPAIKPEDSLPPRWSFTPTIFLSAGQWEMRAREVRDALFRAVAGQKTAKDRAREIVAGLEDREAKIIAIRDFAARNIRAAGPGLNHLPLSSITPADQTLREGYGNTSDRAAALYCLLQSAGLRPEFVLASWSPREAHLRERLLAFPSGGFFSDVLVRVRLGEDYVYLNDTSQYDILGATSRDGRVGFVLQKGWWRRPGRMIDIRATKEDDSCLRFYIELEADGNARITRTRRFFGGSFGANNRFFSELPPEERNRYHQEAVVSISQAAKPDGDLLTRFDGYPGIEEFSVRVERYAVREGDYLYLNLPGSLHNLLGLRSDERVNALYWETPRRSSTETIVVLPPEFREIILKPEEMHWEAPAEGGLVTVRVSKLKDGSGGGPVELQIAHEVDLKPAVIQTGDYDSLLEINRRLSHPRSRTLLLGKE